MGTIPDRGRDSRGPRPQNLRAILALATAERREGREHEARRVLSAGIAANSGRNGELWIALACMECDAGNLDRAKEAVENAIRSDGTCGFVLSKTTRSHRCGRCERMACVRHEFRIISEGSDVGGNLQISTDKVELLVELWPLERR